MLTRHKVHGAALAVALAVTASLLTLAAPAGASQALGVQMPKDIRPGTASSSPTLLTNVNGTVFFRANDGVSGNELWKSDGTTAGTVRVKDISPGTGSGLSTAGMVNFNGTLYFNAQDNAENGAELWKSDGTETGTVIAADMRVGDGSNPTNLTVVGNTLYFTASNGSGLNGVELWKFDGTTATMVKDIVVGSGTSSPGNLRAANGLLYFTATTAAEGTEPWTSNGTEAGTVMLKDINPGPASSSGASNSPQFTTAAGKVFFTANEPDAGIELWATDGTTAGTDLVEDINPGSNANPNWLVSSNGVLFFAATDPVAGEGELWRSDGTEAGTVLVKDINPGAGGAFASTLTDVNGTVFFSATATSTFPFDTELYKSDGTAAGTGLVKDIGVGFGSGPTNLTNVNGTLFFSAFQLGIGRELFTTDGTAAGTFAVADINPGEGGWGDPLNLTNVNGTLFFSATNGTTAGRNGRELWRTTLNNSPVAVNDAYSTAEDTPLVVTAPGVLANDTDADGNALTAVLVAGPANGNVTLNGDGSFTYTPTANYNGPDSFTYKVRDGVIGTTGPVESNVATVNITVVEPPPSISASPASVIAGEAVTATWADIPSPTATDWVGLYDSSSAPDPALVAWTFTNGAADGSVNLTVPVDAASGSTYELRLFSNNTYTRLATSAPFTVTELTVPQELGVQRLSDIRPGPADGLSAFSSNLTNVNGTLFFVGDDPAVGGELFKSDGTVAGTVLVKDIWPGENALVTDLVNFNGTLFFAAIDTEETSLELWKSDGTAAGTVLVKDINPSEFGDSSPSNLTVVGDTLFFSASEGINGTELWKSDGTAAGTVLVKDINPTVSSNPGNFYAFNGKLFFTANDGTNGVELWTSDGTAAGTVLVEDINPGAGSSFDFSNPPRLTEAGGKLFFVPMDPDAGIELWTTDGTAAGTALVKDINVGSNANPSSLVESNGVLFFAATDPVAGVGELWRSDGTEAGTVLVKDVNPGAAGAFAIELTDVNGTLFFQANSSPGFPFDEELWKSDGTTAGTVMVKDIGVGFGSGPIHLTNVDGTLFFSAFQLGIGRELFTSDGTAEGTFAVADIWPGEGGWGDPANLTNVNGSLFFTATDGNSAGAHGRELWRTTLTDVAPEVSASPDPVTAGGTVTATWSDITAPTATDWVGLYDSSSAPDSALLAWAYTGGGAAGNVGLSVPAGATPGTTYELRMFANNTYTRLATSTPFGVVAANTTLVASPSSVNAGGAVTAAWSGIPAPSATDWVGVYDSSAAADSAPLVWSFTDGNGAGNLNLTVPVTAASGSSYELRLFSNNSYTRLATSNAFSVTASAAAITVTQTSVADGNPITANWSGIAAPSATDWVGLYASGSDPDSAILAWAYTGGAANGSLNLVVPAGSAAGSTYEVRLFSNNTYTRLATSGPFTVT